MKEHHGITVTGTGEAEAAPDTAQADLGISVLAPTAQEASSAAAAAATALIEALTAQGVDRADIRTVGYSLAAEYEWTEKGRKDLGFRAVNTVQAMLRDPATAGVAIDSVVSAAGDSVTVSNLAFSISNSKALESQAREAAWADANARASQIATLAGTELGTVASVVELDQAGGPPMPMARMMAMEAGSTPIEGGTQKVRVALRVRFHLAD